MSTKRYKNRLRALIEAVANVISGFLLSIALIQTGNLSEPYIQKYLYSNFIWSMSIQSNLILSTALTIMSLVRQYFWRRYFHKRWRR